MLDFVKKVFEEPELLPEGEYEALIIDTKSKTYSSGNEGIEVKLFIRDDIEQEGAETELIDRLVDCDNPYKLRSIPKVIPSINPKTCKSLDDMADLMIGKPVRIYITKKKDGFGEIANNVSRYIEEGAYFDIRQYEQEKDVD